MRVSSPLALKYVYIYIYILTRIVTCLVTSFDMSAMAFCSSGTTYMGLSHSSEGGMEICGLKTGKRFKVPKFHSPESQHFFLALFQPFLPRCSNKCNDALNWPTLWPGPYLGFWGDSTANKNLKFVPSEFLLFSHQP